MDDLLEQVPTIVDAIRHGIDRDRAIAVVEQLVRTAYSGGRVDATIKTSESMLRALNVAPARV